MTKRILIVILTLLLVSSGFCVLADESPALPSVCAKSAVLIEASGGDVVFEKDAHTRMPMASTTKIMTALIACENGDLSKEVRVSEQAAGVEGSSVYLTAGEKLTLEQLLYALMLESANDAAAAIAYEIAGGVENFSAMMNKKAEQLGLCDTHFTNPHGLDNEQHYTTAFDLAVLASRALENEQFRKIVSTGKTTIPLNGSDGTRVLLNHNRLLKSYDGAIGVKTGFTKKSGRCLVSAAERDGVTMIAVTLSDPDDWNDHAAMLDYGFSLYESYDLCSEQSVSFEIPATGGEKEAVVAENREALSVTLPRSESEISVSVQCPRIVYAPVCEGDFLGWAVYSRDGVTVGKTALYAREGLSEKAREKKHFFGLF